MREQILCAQSLTYTQQSNDKGVWGGFTFNNNDDVDNGMTTTTTTRIYIANKTVYKKMKSILGELKMNKQMVSTMQKLLKNQLLQLESPTKLTCDTQGESDDSYDVSSSVISG